MVIGVVGNIASGKSTVTSLLQQEFGWPAHQELFAENPFLVSFYGEPSRWGLSSQLFFLAEKARQGQHEVKTNPAPIQLWDSPIQHNAWTFAQAQHRLGNCTLAEWELYQRLFGLLEPTLPQLDAVFWMQTSLGEVQSRIVSRARSFEQSIPAEYLALLDTLNAEWVESLSVPVISVRPEDLDLSSPEKEQQSAQWLKNRLDEVLQLATVQPVVEPNESTSQEFIRPSWTINLGIR